MKKKLFEVRNITKLYGQNQVLNNLSFEIEQSVMYGLLGKNGAGKTTLLECIEGLREYDSGEVLILGRKINNPTMHNNIGIMLQNDSLPPMLKIKEAIDLFSETKQCTVSEELIKELDINYLMDKKYYQLSTGQKRIVSFFLALNHNPKLIFLDEPTAGLDVEAKANVYKVINKYKSRGATFILTSHDMSEIEKIADTIGILSNGKIIYEATPKQITSMSGNMYKISYLLNNKDQYEEILTDNIMNSLLSIIEKTKQSNYSFEDLRVERPTLEESFMKILEENQREEI